jgi:hypothetical protein
MNRVAEFQWLDAVQDAVHERDPAKLEAKIKREIAIFRRIHTFRSLWGDVEGQGLFDALRTICLLKNVARPIPERNNESRELDSNNR